MLRRSRDEERKKRRKREREDADSGELHSRNCGREKSGNEESGPEWDREYPT